MRVVRKACLRKKFSEIENSTTFEYNDNIYIKIPTAVDIFKHEMNAVCLSNGKVSKFEGKIEVAVVECELVVIA